MAETFDSFSRDLKSYQAGLRNKTNLPHSLKRRAAALLGRHTADEVADLIGLRDSKTVELWRARFVSEQATAPAETRPSAFVELRAPLDLGMVGSGTPGPLEIEIDGDRGRVRLKGVFDADTLRMLVGTAFERSAWS